MAWINLPKTGPDSWQGIRVAFKCMCVMALTAGNLRASGVIYVGIMNHFGVTREEAAWPVSLAGAMLSLIGTVAGPLAQAFSPKPVILCGSLLVTTGLVASVFAPSVGWLTVTYGLVFGGGLGTVYTINVIFLQQYFVKMRGLALGLNYAGSTTAGFIYPVLITFLLGQYGFQGTILIISGMSMHIFVVCLTHREAPWLRDNADHKDVETLGSTELDGVPARNGQLTSSTPAHDAELSHCKREATEEPRETTRNAAEEPVVAVEEPSKPGIAEKKSKTIKYMESVSVELPNVSAKSRKPDEEASSTKKVSLVESLSILKIPEFLVIIFSFSLFFYAYDAFVTTIIDFTVDQNIPLATATTVVPLYSVTDMVARLVIPQLGDRGYINKMLLQCFAYASQSVCFFLLPIAAATGEFFWIAALAMVHSIGIGTSIVMYGVLMAELIGIERLPMAYGIVGLFVGSTYVTKPFFVGYFRDTIGDYSLMYIVCGVLTGISSVCWLTTWYMHWDSARKRKASSFRKEAGEQLQTDSMNGAASINEESTNVDQGPRTENAVVRL